MSEDAAAGGRGRGLNSSFRVVSLRVWEGGCWWDEVTARAQILTLLSAGSLRELIRLADQSWPPLADSDGIDRDHWLIMKTLEAEASALLGEIINVYSAQNGTGDVIVKVWNRLPHEAFSSVDGFVELSRSAIRDLWPPNWSDAIWKAQIAESWQRLLVRLFVSGRVIAPSQITGASHQYSPQDMSDLRDVLIMARQSSAVARAMLQDGFGPDLDDTYQAPSGIRLLPDSAG